MRQNPFSLSFPFCPPLSSLFSSLFCFISQNGKPYFYYYCNDCKISIKENAINDYFNQFIDELVEYDSVVNQFFLPMIKQKFDEPKEQLEKEINEQRTS